MSDIAKRLRISRTYVRGPGDVGYDAFGEHDKSDGKPVGNVEDERREAADRIAALEAELADQKQYWEAYRFSATENMAKVLAVVEAARRLEREKDSVACDDAVCGVCDALSALDGRKTDG